MVNGWTEGLSVRWVWYKDGKCWYCLPVSWASCLKRMLSRRTPQHLLTTLCQANIIVLCACVYVIKTWWLVLCFQSLLMFVAVYVVIIKATIDAGGLAEVWEIAVNGSRVEFDKWVAGRRFCLLARCSDLLIPVIGTVIMTRHQAREFWWRCSPLVHASWLCSFWYKCVPN